MPMPLISSGYGGDDRIPGTASHHRLPEDTAGSSPTATASSSSAVPFPDYSKVRADGAVLEQAANWLDLTLAPSATNKPSNIISTDAVASDRPGYGFFHNNTPNLQLAESSACGMHPIEPSTIREQDNWSMEHGPGIHYLGSNEKEMDSLNSPQLRNADQNSGAVAEPRVFGCQFCTRKFYSSQALGGHQNAHKRERSAGRKMPKLPSPFLPLQSARIPSMLLGGGAAASPSLIDHPMARSLGIKAHSLIHKPSSFRLNDTSYRGPSLPQAHHGWSPALIGQQLGVGRCELAASTPSNSGRPAMLGVGKFESSFGYGGSRFSNPFGDDEASSFTWQSPNRSSTTDMRQWSRFESSPLQPVQENNSNAMHMLMTTTTATTAESMRQAGNDGGRLGGASSLDLSLRL